MRRYFINGNTEITDIKRIFCVGERRGKEGLVWEKTICAVCTVPISSSCICRRSSPSPFQSTGEGEEAHKFYSGKIFMRLIFPAASISVINAVT